MLRRGASERGVILFTGLRLNSFPRVFIGIGLCAVCVALPTGNPFHVGWVGTCFFFIFALIEKADARVSDAPSSAMSSPDDESDTPPPSANHDINV